MTKRLTAVVLLVLCLFFVSAFRDAPSKQQGPQGHCVMKIAPIRAGHVSSDVLSYRCYSTFAQAILAATGGRVHLASTVRPQDVTQVMLEFKANAPNTTEVIGVE